MATDIVLTMAIADDPHTAEVRNGSIPIEGVKPEFVTVKPQIAAFRRMVRQVEFDVCELAPTTYLIAKAYFDHLAAKDKQLVFVEGATHGFTPCRSEYGATVARTFDYADEWLKQPGRFPKAPHTAERARTAGVRV